MHLTFADRFCVFVQVREKLQIGLKSDSIVGGLGFAATKIEVVSDKRPTADSDADRVYWLHKPTQAERVSMSAPKISQLESTLHDGSVGILVSVAKRAGRAVTAETSTIEDASVVVICDVLDDVFGSQASAKNKSPGLRVSKTFMASHLAPAVAWWNGMRGLLGLKDPDPPVKGKKGKKHAEEAEEVVEVVEVEEAGGGAVEEAAVVEGDDAGTPAEKGGEGEDEDEEEEKAGAAVFDDVVEHDVTAEGELVSFPYEFDADTGPRMPFPS
jgi:hypothetical protein